MDYWPDLEEYYQDEVEDLLKMDLYLDWFNDIEVGTEGPKEETLRED